MKTEAAQKEMFGCTTADIARLVSTSFAEPTMLATSILSDAQELLALGKGEKARQHINIAKYIIGTALTSKPVKAEDVEQSGYITRADLMNHPEFEHLEKDSEGNPCVWKNDYRCECGEEWDGVWSCQCDDECGICGKDISPDESEWIGPDEGPALELWENLPEAGSAEGDAAMKAARLPKFSIILTRNVTESAIVRVSAEDESSANTEAMRMDVSTLNWAVDDGNAWEPPYITGTEEV